MEVMKWLAKERISLSLSVTGCPCSACRSQTGHSFSVQTRALLLCLHASTCMACTYWGLLLDAQCTFETTFDCFHGPSRAPASAP